MLNLELLDELCRPREGTPADMAETAPQKHTSRLNLELLDELCRPREGTPADMAEMSVEILPPPQGVSMRNPSIQVQSETASCKPKIEPTCNPSDTRPCDDTETSPSLKYVRGHGESLKAYMQRTRIDLFLFLRDALKPEVLTREQERAIINETRKGYLQMWEGEKAYRNGHFFSREKANEILHALDGALIKDV